jgi:hypothetical protein
MKKILLLFSILSATFANSQTSIYRTFPANYGYWLYQYYDGGPCRPCDGPEYILTGDTVLSGVTYKKIFYYGNYAGALRESSKVIYFVPDTSATEYVLYDFNISIGDTIIHPFGGSSCSNDTLYVSSTDSILCSDGYHKTYSFQPFSSIWIEGIGSRSYLLAPLEILCVSPNDFIECMINDTVFNYPSNMTSCILAASNLNSTELDFFIYPNPSDGNFTIDFNENKFTEINISDPAGKIIYHEQSNNQSKITISNLKTGLYYLTATEKNGRILNKKIVCF